MQLVQTASFTCLKWGVGDGYTSGYWQVRACTRLEGYALVPIDLLIGGFRHETCHCNNGNGDDGAKRIDMFHY